MKKLGLKQVHGDLEQLALRDVDFMVYRDVGEALARHASIPVR